jgi:hypothetical protein
LEREKAQIAERLELEFKLCRNKIIINRMILKLVSRDQMSEAGNLSKKLEKLQDQTERLSEELDTVKRERD